MRLCGVLSSTRKLGIDSKLDGVDDPEREIVLRCRNDYMYEERTLDVDERKLFELDSRGLVRPKAHGVCVMPGTPVITFGN